MELSSGLISISAALNLIKTAEEIDIPADISEKLTLTLGDGTGDNQIQKLFYKKNKTLVASAADSHDLSGALTDPYGDAAVFTAVRLILIANTSDKLEPTSAAGIKIGAGSNPLALFSDATDALPLPAGGIFHWSSPLATGLAVTAGTGDILKITNLSGSELARYTLLVLGI